MAFCDCLVGSEEALVAHERQIHGRSKIRMHQIRSIERMTGVRWDIIAGLGPVLLPYLIEAGIIHHEHEQSLARRETPRREDPDSGVVSHATALVEHPERWPFTSSRSLKSSAEKTSSPAPIAAWAAASTCKSPGPNCAPCATARSSRARRCGVEFKSACAG
jgi:hypothetical protein